eukprot:768683-Hanusia_phi.AAC.9
MGDMVRVQKRLLVVGERRDLSLPQPQRRSRRRQSHVQDVAQVVVLLAQGCLELCRPVREKQRRRAGSLPAGEERLSSSAAARAPGRFLVFSVPPTSAVRGRHDAVELGLCWESIGLRGLHEARLLLDPVKLQLEERGRLEVVDLDLVLEQQLQLSALRLQHLHPLFLRAGLDPQRGLGEPLADLALLLEGCREVLKAGDEAVELVGLGVAGDGEGLELGVEERGFLEGPPIYRHLLLDLQLRQLPVDLRHRLPHPRNALLQAEGLLGQLVDPSVALLQLFSNRLLLFRMVSCRRRAVALVAHELLPSQRQLVLPVQLPHQPLQLLIRHGNHLRQLLHRPAEADEHLLLRELLPLLHQSLLVALPAPRLPLQLRQQSVQPGVVVLPRYVDSLAHVLQSLQRRELRVPRALLCSERRRGGPGHEAAAAPEAQAGRAGDPRAPRGGSCSRSAACSAAGWETSPPRPATPACSPPASCCPLVTVSCSLPERRPEQKQGQEVVVCLALQGRSQLGRAWASE